MHRRVERPLGNLASFDAAGRRIERVALRSEAMTRRIVRIASSVGDLALVLDDVRLRDGDVVYADERTVVAIGIEPDDVIVAWPDGIGSAIELAHALGNRHLPLQRDGDALIVAYTEPAAALCERAGVRWERQLRVLRMPFVHANAPHEHVS